MLGSLAEDAVVEVDPQVLLVLIAVRLAPEHPVPAGGEPFKMLKKPLQIAKQQGLIVENKAEIRTTNKTGKVALKKVAVLELTAEGEKALRSGANPEVQATVAAQHQAALLKALENDRATLKHEVVAALTTKSKIKPLDPSKAIADLDKTLKQLADKLEKLQGALHSQSDDAVLAGIDKAFAKLSEKLVGHTTSSAHAPPAAASPAQESLTDALRQAYSTLRQFHEFESGLVPIPNLYHELRRQLPTLTVAALHRELQKLWEERQLELKILNEVRLGSELDKAIHRGENLYYFVYWPGP